MSSTLTIYKVSETLRSEFEFAYTNEKKTILRSSFFRKKEVTIGEQYLWEYLDEIATESIDFEYSGSVFIDYFLTFVVLPEDLQTALNTSFRGENYCAIDAGLADRIKKFLETATPSVEILTAYANREGREGVEYVSALLNTHNQIIEWFNSCEQDSFLVLHLTF